MNVFAEKQIVLGVSGSIAAYKAIELARRLTQHEARVDVILTPAATQFVTAQSFRSLTHRNVVTDQFDPRSEMSVEHVRLAERADLLLVAPATADLIARFALGLADDALTSTHLACRAPIIIAPAMNVNMLEHPATQQHIRTLADRGAIVIDPETGPLATGLVAKGRLAEIDTILAHAAAVLGRAGDLAGRTVVVTAGGTREPIDPVRFIGNRSSGKMGYALAAAARDRGAKVTLISGPTSIPAPGAVEFQSVGTAAEMREAVLAASDQADIVLKAAAVGDFQAEDPAESKIKRPESGELTLRLTANPDILAELGKRRETSGRPAVLVGFAAETEDIVENARKKLAAKNADLIVVNDVSAPDTGFGSENNRVVILDRQGGTEEWPLLPKAEVAHRILSRIVPLLQETTAKN